MSHWLKHRTMHLLTSKFCVMWDVGRGKLAQELLAWVGYGLQVDICGQTANTSQSFLLGVVVDCTYICGQTEHIYQSLLRGVIDCTLIFGQIVYYQLPV
jgi:hypothetical protein